MKFLEACILTGSAPARASSVFPRADDSFSVADLMAAYDAQVRTCIQIFCDVMCT